MVTAVGRIALERTYYRCPHCRLGTFAADPLVGVEGALTDAAQRMIIVAGTQQSFARGQRQLRELTGWEVDDETIRRVCHAQAIQVAQWRADAQPATPIFAAAAGGWELQIDAGKVNTETGWRDVKMADIAKREAGAPTDPATWQDRDVPPPTVRRVVAAIEEAADFGVRCRQEMDRLQLPDETQLDVLGDGAEWIWNLKAEQFPQARELLDFYHGTEHLAEAARHVLGADAAATKTAFEEGRGRLLADGYWGVTEWIGTLAACIPAAGDGAALGKTLNYFAGHQNRLNYPIRLRQGRVIGSGLIEGTVKQVLNRRLKQTGARWKTRHVGPFVELVAFLDSPEWSLYWLAA